MRNSFRHSFRLLGAIAVLVASPFCSLASATELSALNAPADYKLVWRDEFETLSLREKGAGVWESFGGNDSSFRGEAGFGYDFFANPRWAGWPASVADLRVMTPEGLRLRARQPSPAEASLIPLVKGKPAWISSSLGGFGLNIKPPFYIEFKARMPAAASGESPWGALWLYANPRQRETQGLNLNAGSFEVDVQEGFGDSDQLASNLHWDKGEYTRLSGRTFVKQRAGVDLSTAFHTWGALVTTTEVVAYFDGAEVGRVAVPAEANSNQPLGVLLDVSAGLPWINRLPAGGPYDMTVRYVRIFAPDTASLAIGSRSN